MKNSMFVKSAMVGLLAFAATSAAARTGNSSTGGMPHVSTDDIYFVVHQNSGFSPRPINLTLTVQADGKVVAETQTDNGVSQKSIAVLDLVVVRALQHKAFELGGGTLVDQQAGDPRCTDAPSTSFSFAQPSLGGAAQTFYSIVGCHQFSIELGAAFELKAALQALVTVADLVAE